MRTFFFSVFFTLSVFANDQLIDLYQKEGFQSIESIFDTELTTKEYWERRLHEVNTDFGFLEGINYILACNKDNASLTLYTKDDNNSFIQNTNFSAFIGKQTGDKQREGDLKTPIGVYRIIQKLDKVDSFYGPLAFVTSYPNTFDVVQGKNGSGIWVHGLPYNQERDDFTKGCIAINNSNLEQLKDQINFKEALVYIDVNAYPKVQKEELITLLSQLYAWRKAWKENDISSYLDFYDQEFKRNDGLSISRFKEYKSRVFSKNEYKQIRFSKINIVPYPMAHKENIYLISFTEEYNSPSYHYNGEKELYVHLNSGKFTILAEK